MVAQCSATSSESVLTFRRYSTDTFAEREEATHYHAKACTFP
jgi:hypothetical protein